MTKIIIKSQALSKIAHQVTTEEGIHIIRNILKLRSRNSVLRMYLICWSIAAIIVLLMVRLFP